MPRPGDLRRQRYDPAIGADGPAPLTFDDIARLVVDLAGRLQGEHDLMVPPAHGRWLGDHVSGAELHLSEADGHISLLETRMPAIVAAISRYTF